MAPRIFTFLVICALAMLLAHREDNRNNGNLFDDLHYGWLHANSHLEHSTSKVLLIALDDGDFPTAERIFQSWPLSELDYALLLDNLFQNHPRAVAIEPALAWPKDGAPFLDSLATRFHNAPPMVLGSLAEFSEFSAEPVDGTPPEDTLQATAERHMRITAITGDRKRIPAMTQFLGAPAKAVTGAIPLAVTHIDLGDNVETPGDGTLRVPLMARAEDQVVATFPLAALLLHRGITPDTISVELGRRITGPELSIPIDDAGRFTLDLSSLQSLPEINARLFALSTSTTDPANSGATNEVITGLIESDADYAKVKLLGTHLAVIGQNDRGAHRFATGSSSIGSTGSEDDTSLSRAEVFCQTIAALDLGQKLVKAPPWSDYAIAGTALLLMLWLLRYPRTTVMKVTILLALLLAMASLLAFQQWHFWFPIFTALVVIASAALATLLVPGHKGNVD
ncbi:MAG: CHASE2 domain-containing protein [Verrucomicrobia bacterium]|nr:CHASE2 domain-containing protein [Verrucomicrobiota bacterium]